MLVDLHNTHFVSYFSPYTNYKGIKNNTNFGQITGVQEKLDFIIQQAVQCFHIFLRPFNNYSIFFLQLPLSFQSSSINPFSPISTLIPSAQVSLGLPRFILPGGRHFIISFGNLPSLKRKFSICKTETVL